MSLEDAAVEDVAIENVDVQNAAVQNAPVQNVPVQNAAVEGRAGPPDVESGNEVAQVETQECVACGDAKSFTDIVGLPCNHNFCVRCVVDFFTASLRDDSLFPPRCCQIPIPLQSVAGFLALDTLAIFQQKAFEMEVANRTYCSSPACASFILPSRIVDNKATCEMCNTATCTLCKGDFHTGECPEDPGMKSLESTAAANGWKRCSSCRTFIELEGGCYHITLVRPPYPVVHSGIH